MNFARIKLSLIEEGGAQDARGAAPTSPAAIKKSVADLIASIKQHGLLQPIVVRAHADAPRYTVVAGNRRLRALRIIHGKKDAEVPVMIATVEEAGALELSLVENFAREQMHPVEEFEAFAKLVDAGASPELIAARFNVTERFVKQRLQLRRLAPSLRDLWRAGKLTADQAAALSSAEGHELQEQVWKGSQKQGDWYLKPQELRNAIRRLSKGIATDDPLVEFVGGIDAYTAAGGEIKADLFSDEQTLTNPGVLARLERERLEAECVRLRREGWLFADVGEERSRWSIKTLDLKPWHTPTTRARMTEDQGWRPGYEAMEAARARAEADPAAKTLSGCVVMRSGAEIDVLTLVAPDYKEGDREDAANDADNGDNDPRDDDDDGEGEASSDATPPPAIIAEQAQPEAAGIKPNATRTEWVSERLTLALSEALAGAPAVALAALAATLRMLVASRGDATPLRLEARGAWGALAKRDQPADSELWAKDFSRYAHLSVDALLTFIAADVSMLLDLRECKVSDRGREFIESRDMLVAALALQLKPAALASAVAKHFDRADYFARLTKDDLEFVLNEMGHEGTRPAGKAGLVALAIETAEATGWLPPELRVPGLAALPERASQREAAE